jgi:hypothetical protein
MRDDLEKWAEKWDKALADGVFETPKEHVPSPEVNPSDFFGNWRPAAANGEVIKDVDSQYWNNVYKLSSHSGEYHDPLEVEHDAAMTGTEPVSISEELDQKDINASKDRVSKLQDKPLRNTPSKEDLGVKAKELGNTANPIYPESRGKDQRRHVTPSWTDGPQLLELVNMKLNLYKLEVKLNSDKNFGAFQGDTQKMKEVQDQIEFLKGEIDKLSNSLSPDFIEDENS